MGKGLHGGVLDRLGRRIAAGDLPAGTVLTLAGLEAELGVSRTVVREAVRVLEAVGMVTSRQRVGITVQPEDAWHALDPQVIQWRLAGPGRYRQLVELTELRLAVEPTAARLAARYADAPTRARLVELADRLHALGADEQAASAAYLDADVAFHTVLLRAGGNPLLGMLGGAVTEVLAGRAALGLMPEVPAEQSLDGHRAVALAVAQGEEDEAERQTRAVVEEVWRAVVAAARRDGRPTR
ncbi:FadR/GntR family transcriptional regulator [Cellulomonas sp. SLBN-39]|uniref:FadR/GntR family transcriptional regulator n=1 Tax=Cellulomonas sp. SLBN-39 TaxID=2768446 RepID=UPI00114F0ED7|nr:FCD domain-containing protein [Cellulomonas sp. SLBN-39]TQL04608.1 GntR family transcriptional regulator [Cellulomonas sp. SLBN-39]